MKFWLKYLLLSMVALAFHCGAKADFHTHEDVRTHDNASAYTASFNANVTSPKSDICIPRQVSSVSSPRLQSSSNRHETSHRQNWEFVKSGKTLNSIIRYSVQLKSLNIHFSLMESANKLVSLCRLII